jgi:hypothetical protein
VKRERERERERESPPLPLPPPTSFISRPLYLAVILLLCLFIRSLLPALVSLFAIVPSSVPALPLSAVFLVRLLLLFFSPSSRPYGHTARSFFPGFHLSASHFLARELQKSDQPTDRPTDQATKRPTKRPAGQPVVRPIGQSRRTAAPWKILRWPERFSITTRRRGSPASEHGSEGNPARVLTHSGSHVCSDVMVARCVTYGNSVHKFRDDHVGVSAIVRRSAPHSDPHRRNWPIFKSPLRVIEISRELSRDGYDFRSAEV